MKKKMLQVYEVDPEEFKNEILAGVEKLLKEFSEQLTPKHPEIWMNRKEIGEFLGISLVTIHNWSKDGILKPYKIGNRVRFRKSDIDQTLLSSNRIENIPIKDKITGMVIFILLIAMDKTFEVLEKVKN